MNIRKAEERDIPRITEIYAGARAFMAAHGNPTQWNDGYPDEACIRADMKADTLHVIERDGKIAGVFALIIGEDPCYAVIDGAWHAARPYGTIHRIASDGVTKGIAGRRSISPPEKSTTCASTRTKTTNPCRRLS